MQAVNCGLLSEVEFCIQSGEVEAQRNVLSWFFSLTASFRAVAKMPGDGVFPLILLGMADCPHPDVLLSFGLVASDMPHLRPLLEELMAAGLLERLKVTWKTRCEEYPQYGGKLRGVLADLEAFAKQHAGGIRRSTRDRPAGERHEAPSRKVLTVPVIDSWLSTLVRIHA